MCSQMMYTCRLLYKRTASFLLATLMFVRAYIVYLSANESYSQLHMNTLVFKNTSMVFPSNISMDKIRKEWKSNGTLWGVWFDSGFPNDNDHVITMYPGRGRLGNQMFQLASLLGIAAKYGFKPFITTTGFDYQSVFSVPTSNQVPVSVNITSFREYQEAGVDTFEERDISMYIEPSTLDNDVNWKLDGYFQSYKYFMHIENDIRRFFRFQDSVIDEARNFLDNTVGDNSIKVGIHVRRGDFLSDYHVRLGRVTPGAEFFEKAMDYYRQRYGHITFLVFSNDIAWCKDNIRDNEHRVIFSPFDQPGYDLALMSFCDHMIISVGTFGWWGGWLSGGTVIYYQGYPRPGSEIDQHFIKEDFYPPYWIGIY